MHLHHLQTTTLICQDLETMVAAYTLGLGLSVVRRSEVEDTRAMALGDAALAGKRCAYLSWNLQGIPWFELIEVADAQQSQPFARLGWFALELLVQDVDQLAKNLAVSESGRHFRILGQPKALDISDAIKAMQVEGPAGEVLYLTEVKRPLAPFRLPLSSTLQQAIGAPFVAVLASNNRRESAAFYLGLGGDSTLEFDACLGAFNNVHGHLSSAKHPVATVQLRGEALLEIDEIKQPLTPATLLASSVTGIYSIALARIGTRGQAGPARVLRGPSGEQLELM